MTVTVDKAGTSPTKVKAITSPNGVEAWHVESDVVPLIAVAFIFEAARPRTPGKAGVAQMLSRLLDEGAGEYDSDAFQERLAARAIELLQRRQRCHRGLAQDAREARRRSLRAAPPRAGRAALRPRRDRARPRPDDRGPALPAERSGRHGDPPLLLRRLRGHPYGHPTSGTIESVKAITREDLAALHRAIVAKGHAKIAVVGAIDEERLAALLDKVFGALPDAGLAEGHRADVAAAARRAVVVDLDVPQSVIRFGMNGVPVRDPDFIPAFVLNHILGGGAFTSRLFQEVREKRGLAYSVGTSLVSRAAAMTWGYTATKNERVAEVDVIQGEMARLKSDGPSDEELQKAKDYLTAPTRSASTARPRSPTP